MSALVCVSILPLKLITSAGEVFELMNADATGLDFSCPLE
jgi:hypothetical protein